MLISVLLALCASAGDEDAPGIHSPSGDFLPLLPKTAIDGRGMLPDYPENKIPIKRLFRFVSSFQVSDGQTYGLQKAFGQITNIKDSNDFVWNFTSYGIGGRLSNEDQATFLHLCELDGEFEPNTYGLTVWGKVTSEQGLNYSVLLFNETATFYEVVDVREQVGSVVLYVFFVGVVAGILYIIFSKDKVKTTQDKVKRKKEVIDYSKMHASSGEIRTPSASPPKKKRGQTPPK